MCRNAVDLVESRYSSVIRCGVGCACVSEGQLGIFPEIVRPQGTAFALVAHPDCAQNCILVRRSVVFDRPAIHPLAHLPHRVPWCVRPTLCPCVGSDARREAYWCERPELFAAISDAKTDEERSVAVLKWFIVRGSWLDYHTKCLQ